MNDNEVEVSKLEKVLINLCTPVLYACAGDMFSFHQLVDMKVDDYKRLVKYLEKEGHIPLRIRAPYCISPCGNLALGTVYLRKYFL